MNNDYVLFFSFVIAFSLIAAVLIIINYQAGTVITIRHIIYFGLVRPFLKGLICLFKVINAACLKTVLNIYGLEYRIQHLAIIRLIRPVTIGLIYIFTYIGRKLCLDIIMFLYRLLDLLQNYMLKRKT